MKDFLYIYLKTIKVYPPAHGLRKLIILTCSWVVKLPSGAGLETKAKSFAIKGILPLQLAY